MRHLIFIVDDNSWPEHRECGIAAINDPGVHKSKQAMSGRQSAMAEVAGIRPGDRIYFCRRVSDEHPPELIGIYRAKSAAYFDTKPIYPGATYIGSNHPFRIMFNQEYNLVHPVNMDLIWLLANHGIIWSLQQSRGNAVGVHACQNISNNEAATIERLLFAHNTCAEKIVDYDRERKRLGIKPPVKSGLPLNLVEDSPGKLHYEKALQALLVEDLADGKHREILGDYDEFLPSLPTGSRKEVDLLLMKHIHNMVAWQNVIELKATKFSMKELQRLIEYEQWFLATSPDLLVQVYATGIAAEFGDDVIEYVKGREKYMERPIRLIRYAFDARTRQITLSEVT